MRCASILFFVFIIIFSFVGCSSISTDDAADETEELSPEMVELKEEAGDHAGTSEDPLNQAGLEFFLRDLPYIDEGKSLAYEAEEFTVLIDAVLIEDGMEEPVVMRRPHPEYPSEGWSCARFDDDGSLTWISRTVQRFGLELVAIGVEFEFESDVVSAIVYRRDYDYNNTTFRGMLQARVRLYIERTAYDWFVGELIANGMAMPGEEMEESADTIVPTEPTTPELPPIPMEENFFFQGYGDYLGEPEEGRTEPWPCGYGFEFMNTRGMMSSFSQDAVVDGQIFRLETILEIDNRGLVVIYSRVWLSSTESHAMRDGSSTVPLERLQELTREARAWLAPESH